MAPRAPPFFTTRVGNSVVSHEPQEPRARRTAAELKSDPRAKFKDSYSEAAKHFQKWLPSSAPPVPTSTAASGGFGSHARADDPIAAQQQIELQLELNDARNEILQLRNALRASASALQHAAALMPPEVGFDVQADTRLIQDLTNQVLEKDGEITRLMKGASKAEREAQGSKKALLDAMAKWAPSVGTMELMREPFQAWKGLQSEAKQVKKVQEALRKGKESLQPSILKVIRGLSEHSVAQGARTALEAWKSLAHTAAQEKKLAKEKDRMRQEKVERTLLHWSGAFSNTAKPACFAAWRRALDTRKQDEKEEKQRHDHIRTAKALQKEALARATLAMVPKGTDPQAIKVILGAWRECMLDTRSQKALEAERERAKRGAETVKDQAKRRAAFLVAEGHRPLLNGAFLSWRTFSGTWQKREGEVKRREEKIRMQSLHDLYRAWGAVVVAHRRNKSLEAEKAEMQKELEAERNKHNKMRSSILQLSFAGAETDPFILIGLAMSAWKDACKERLLELERETMRLEWEHEYQAKKQEETTKSRTRQSVVALQVASKAEDVQSELFLRMVLLAWVDAVKESKRESQLDREQRIFEKEKQELEEEKKRLEIEAAKSKQRHGEDQTKRQMLFTMAMNQSNDDWLIRAAYSAWRESMLDARKYEFEEMKTRLSQLEGAGAVRTSLGRSLDETGPSFNNVDQQIPVKPGLLQRCCGCFFGAPKKSRANRPQKVWQEHSQQGTMNTPSPAPQGQAIHQPAATPPREEAPPQPVQQPPGTMTEIPTATMPKQQSAEPATETATKPESAQQDKLPNATTAERPPSISIPARSEDRASPLTP